MKRRRKKKLVNCPQCGSGSVDKAATPYICRKCDRVFDGDTLKDAAKRKRRR